MIRPSRRRTWTIVTLSIVLAGCHAPPVWHEEDGYRWIELRVPRRGHDGFRHMAPSTTGVTFANSYTDSQLLDNEHVLNGSGVALGDVDGDGLMDIYFARLDGSNVLYQNKGGWKFDDVTAGAGLQAHDRFSTGAAFADIDGDGDLDLVLTALGGPNSIFLNDGHGVFRERPPIGSIGEGRGSTTTTLADIDGDGDLDLYVANYKMKTVRDIYPPAERAFDRVVRQEGGRYVIAPAFEDHYGVRIQRDRLMRFEYGEPDQLYLNDGMGGFEPVSFTSGRFVNEDGHPLRRAPADWGLTAQFHDLDDDGDPDLYVCNDFESPDRIWINDGTGRFRALENVALRTISQSSMAVDFSDIDADGDVDFLTVDMLDLDSGRRKRQTPPTIPDQPAIGDLDSRLQQPRNMLFLNRGDGTYAEIAYYAGLAATGWSWSLAFMDVDLDGFEDVLVGTGHAYDFLDSDTQRRVRTARAGPNWRQTRLAFPPLRLPNLAFRNRGDLTFEQRGEEWGVASEADVSHGMATGDLDGDGDLDVVFNRLQMPAVILRNETNRPRIAVRLEGASPNTRAIGAKVYVVGGPVAQQVREVTAGGMYLSGGGFDQTFAAGESDELVIAVRWRNGRWSTIEGARADRLYEIDENRIAGSSQAPQVVTLPPPTRRPVFRDVSEELDYAHHETPYDDLGRQPLLTSRLSGLGPGVSWHDIDGDGDDDLLVGSGRGGSIGLFRNDGGRFRRVALRMQAAGDLTTILSLPGGSPPAPVLLAGQMNYEARTPADAVAAAGVLRVEIDRRDLARSTARPLISEAVPGTMATVGPLAAADYDGDGDLDLFVGGRVAPARYPTPVSSRLFRNDRGRFTLDGSNATPFSDIGMVSGAVFSDVDVDGDPDLVLAVEWGPIMLFLNRGGRFANATDAAGLAERTSRWNGVATGDLDGDGRPDIVATSWGRNTPFRASRERPLFSYQGDFDRNGQFDVVEVQYDQRLGALAPLSSFLKITRGLPYVGRRLGSFGAYAEATLLEALGPSLSQATVLAVTTLDHTVFMNRGVRFEAHPLPAAAQLAPAFDAAVTDFDGDGAEDLFLSQNFFPTGEERGRYDSGRGLWLRGDGRGGLTPVPGEESGVVAYGDQRGAAVADYDGDGRVDLAISQNGAAMKLYRNEGATPGLRVRLQGPPNNPHAVGATVRIASGGRMGPAREVQAGSGYWSQNAVVQVLAVAGGGQGGQGGPPSVVVRWPGGRESTTPVPEGAREVVVQMPRGSRR